MSLAYKLPLSSVRRCYSSTRLCASNMVKELLVICGPSGVGKGTIIDALLKQYPSLLGLSVSHTTRKPRVNEMEGVHYYYVTHEVINDLIEKKLFIEYAKVHGNVYGTSIQAVKKVQEEGKICVLDVDVEGVKQIKSNEIPAKYVFIAPPSIETLENRLRGRGTESNEQITTRLGNAAREIQYGSTPGNFNAIVINDDLVAATNQMNDLVRDWFPLYFTKK